MSQRITRRFPGATFLSKEEFASAIIGGRFRYREVGSELVIERPNEVFVGGGQYRTHWPRSISYGTYSIERSVDPSEPSDDIARTIKTLKRHQQTYASPQELGPLRFSNVYIVSSAEAGHQLSRLNSLKRLVYSYLHSYLSSDVSLQQLDREKEITDVIERKGTNASVFIELKIAKSDRRICGEAPIDIKLRGDPVQLGRAELTLFDSMSGRQSSVQCLTNTQVDFNSIKSRIDTIMKNSYGDY